MEGLIFLVGVLLFALFIFLCIKGYWDLEPVWLVLALVSICLALAGPLVYYGFYTEPVVENAVHNYCINQGYETFEEWGGVGLFPHEALYVKCKFVDNRKDIQGELTLR